MGIVVSLNRKKYKAGNSIRDLVKENTRDEKTASHYDNGIRNIDINKTRQNVIFEMPKGNIDRFRSKQTDKLNEQRKSKGLRKMRGDYIDVIGNVYQPSEGFEKLTREQQIEHFRTVYEVIKANPHDYGDVFSCAVHFDETTPHMQILTFAQSADDPKRNAKNMFGNKSQMSDFQTEFVEKLRVAGLDVDRGIKRIDNPEYQNFKARAENLGFEVNRHNDRKIRQFIADLSKETKRERKKTKDIQAQQAKHEIELQQRELQILERERILEKDEKYTQEYRVKLESYSKTLDKRAEQLNDQAEEIEKREENFKRNRNALVNVIRNTAKRFNVPVPKKLTSKDLTLFVGRIVHRAGTEKSQEMAKNMISEALQSDTFKGTTKDQKRSREQNMDITD